MKECQRGSRGFLILCWQSAQHFTHTTHTTYIPNVWPSCDYLWDICFLCHVITQLSESSPGSHNRFPCVLVTAAGACWPHFSNKTYSLLVFQNVASIKKVMPHEPWDMIFIHFSCKILHYFYDFPHSCHFCTYHLSWNWIVFFKYLKLRLKETNSARQLPTEIWNSVSRTEALLHVIEARRSSGWERGLWAGHYCYHLHCLCYGVGAFLESDRSQPFLRMYYGPGDLWPVTHTLSFDSYSPCNWGLQGSNMKWAAWWGWYAQAGSTWPYNWSSSPWTTIPFWVPASSLKTRSAATFLLWTFIITPHPSQWQGCHWAERCLCKKQTEPTHVVPIGWAFPVWEVRGLAVWCHIHYFTCSLCLPHEVGRNGTE